MSRTRTIAVAAAAAVVLAAGWSGYWVYAAGALERGLAAWAAERRAEGMTVAYGGVAVTGFPLRWEARVRDPVLARAAAPAETAAAAPAETAPATAGPAFAWRGGEVVAGLVPWRPRRLEVLFPGTHQVTLPLDGREVTVFASAEEAAATLEPAPGEASARARLEARSLVLASADGGASLVIARGVLTGLTRPPGEPAHRSATLELAFAGEGVDLPPDAEPPLGRHIALVQAKASVMGAWPAGTLKAATAGWRDDGGTVEVHRLDLAWGPLRLSAEGTLALDGGLQPLAALTATVRGFAETIDALVAARAVKANDGATAKVVLGLLARTPEGGGEPELTVPVTVQNGRLYVGPVALLRVPPVRWD